MRSRKKIFYFIFFNLLLLSHFSFSQILPSYNISNNFTATACRAHFYDDGGPNNSYQTLGGGAGGTYTFNIFSSNPVLTLTFNPSPSATQIMIGDNITFYKQYPLIPANLIAGPYTNVPVTGTISPVVSNTGSIIVVWYENGNTVGFGWDAGWGSQATPPAPPTVSVSPTPSCNASSIFLNVNNSVICDSLKPNFFVVTGPMFPGVTSVSPVPCSNGTTNVIQLNLTNPLNKNCTYTVNSTLFRNDACDSIYKFQNIVSTFSIADCPVQASVTALPTNTVCAYSCNTTLQVSCPSTVCLNFTYAWNQGLPPTPGPHAVCPTVTTVYSCTLTEQSTLAQTVITKTIFVVNPQISPIPSPTLCQSAAPFTFTGAPGSGTWSGPGITNSLTGLFCPGCTSPGVKTITYQVGTCTTVTQLTIVGIDAGAADAACVGGSSFVVSGGTPPGGTWYGDPDITNGGVFTPTVLGTHTVLYTLGSCTSVPKQINVTNAVTVPTVPINICRSQWYTQFYTGYGVSPFGGRYSMTGPGITDNVYGTFSPSLTTPGPHVITYSLSSGCSNTFIVNVLDIDVSPSTATTCPAKIPFIPATTLSPGSGTWTSSTPGAIIGALTGSYNPSAGGVNSHTDNLVYTVPNGCFDTLQVFAITTTIVQDTLFFCANSPSFQLTSNTINIDYFPSGGTYTGTAVVLTGTNYFFDPSLAGPGIHTVYYDNNTCRDSVKMVVYPNSLSVADRTVCSTLPAFVVSTLVPIDANWSGTGIVNTSTGLFDPSAVLPGTYTVISTPPNGLGCVTQAQITVYQFVAADVSGMAAMNCYRNFNYTLGIVPPGGTLVAPPSFSTNVFNPSVTGSGTFDVVYSFGNGACFTKDSLHVTVYPQFTTAISISKDSLCPGQTSVLSVTVGGGLPSTIGYTYTWSHGLSSLSKQTVAPPSTTIYTVISSDGCSDVVTNTMQVSVKPNFYIAYSTTSIQCFGVNGQATVNISPPGSYSYSWNTSPVQTGTLLSGSSGKTYQVKVRDQNSGCVKDTSFKLPGYNSIKALFSPNPYVACVPFTQKNVAFLDLSDGAKTGTWTINNSQITYTTGESVYYDFPLPGNYDVNLSVLNEGNCSDSYQMTICIQESTEIFIPDIFSPNQDGNNDLLFVRGGIKEMSFKIFDRWGQKVFEGNDPKSGWDGSYNGKQLEPGIYAWLLDATLVNDEKINRKGEITLIR